MNPLTQRLAIAFLSTVMAASIAEAATRRVAQDGSGDHLTIQLAILASSPGDTVSIAPGRYTDHLRFGLGVLLEECYGAITVDSLTIIGDDADSVIVGPETQDWTPSGPWGFATAVETVTFTRIQDVTIVNMREAIRAMGGGEFLRLRIRDSDRGIRQEYGSSFLVQELETDDVLIPVLSGPGSSDVRIVDSVLRVCSLQGVSFTSGSAGFEVRNCVFESCGLKLGFSAEGLVQGCTLTGETSNILLNDFSRLTLLDTTVGPGLIGMTVNGESHVEGSGNVFLGGSVRTLSFAGTSTGSLSGNHIFRRGTGNLVEATAYIVEAVQIDLRDNWWGTTDVDSLRKWIVDGNDLHDPPAFINLSEVLFEPIELRPVSGGVESMGSLKSRFRSRE